MKMKLYTSLIITLLFPALVFSQNTVQEWFDKGVKLKSEKRAADAIIAFKEAVKIKSDYKEAWYEMGWCQNDVKDYGGAILSLNKARSLWPGVPKLHFELAYAFEKTNKNDSAVYHYNQVLQLKSDYASAYKQLGYVYYNKSDNENALNHFLKYEQTYKNPINDYLYWYRKGYVQNAVRQFEAAKISLNKSLELKSDYLNTYLELGFASARLKQDEVAIEYYQKGIELDPKSHIPLNGIAEVYRDNKKDMNEAINWYKKTLELNPDERKANFGMGYCNNSLNNYTEAIPYLQKAIQKEPDYIAAYVELGYSQYKSGDNSSALTSFNKALSLNPRNENARYYSALVYISENNKEMAQKIVDELKTLNSRHAATLQEKVSKL
ncbi:MAG TPA: tetratricopeptide repeat protein [Chitinophagaceae bacterium]|nr:tetratricopeptide repeat protein [Chitinophagaceae bacterium]